MRPINKPPLTVDKWIDMYLSTYKKGVKPRTRRDYELVLAIFTKEYGEYPISDVTQLDVQQFFNKQEGKSFSLVHKLKFLLTSIFETAVKNRLIEINPVSMVIMPTVTKGSHRALTDAERSALLSIARYHYAGTYIMLMLYCGLRPSETIKVQGKDIDLENGILHVRGTKNKSADRYVPIPEPLRLVLSGFQADDYVVTNKQGKPVVWDSLRALWLSISSELSKYVDTKVRPYDLRHTYCTDICATGLPLATVAKIMGHSDTTMITTVYYHATQDHIVSAKDVLDNFYSNKIR